MAFTYRNPARSSDPSRVMNRARSMIVGAYSYGQPVGDRPTGTSARVARYATADFYGRLRESLAPMVTELEGRGHRAVVMADDNSVVDREAAFRAGIGFYGKNANVLLPGQGSFFVLGSIITDAGLALLDPPESEGCGSCQACLDGCPTGAIVAPGVVDARRCLAWLVQKEGIFPHEFREALGDRLYGCDDCQEVCPPTRRGERTVSDAQHEADPGPWVDAVDLLDADDAELLERFGRWYLPNRDPSIIRRNAAIVLGNIAPSGDERVNAALITHAEHPDAAVADAAEWALRHLALRAPLSPRR
jgi:epoxyqueuosine reductase